MAATTAFAGVQCVTSSNGMNRAALFYQSPVSVNFSARPGDLKTLNSLKLKQRDACFIPKRDKVGRSLGSFVVRCDASAGRVSLVLAFFPRILLYLICCNSMFWVIFFTADYTARIHGNGVASNCIVTGSGEGKQTSDSGDGAFNEGSFGAEEWACSPDIL